MNDGGMTTVSLDDLHDCLGIVVLQHCDPLSALRVCIATRWRLTTLDEQVKLRLCGDDSNIDLVSFRIVCEAIDSLPDGIWKRNLIHLLRRKVYVYARPLDRDGKKIDGKLRLYQTTVVSCVTAPYRYHPGVTVWGDYKASRVDLKRFFVSYDVKTRSLYNNWRKCEQNKTKDYFDDACTIETLEYYKDHFDGSDVQILEHLVPLFGFIDSGMCIARSAQSVALNPFVLNP